MKTKLTMKIALVAFFAMGLMLTAPTAVMAQTEKAHQEVDQMPEYQGGMEGMIDYLSKNIKYPKSAKKDGIEGMVVIKFHVEKDGTVSNAEVVKGVHPDCDKEALRVVSGMDSWSPGVKDGKTVVTEMNLPIKFAL